MDYDPVPALEKVKQPGNRDYLIKVFPGADHALLVWPKPNDQVHWPVLASGYLEAMTVWIDKHVALRR